MTTCTPTTWVGLDKAWKDHLAQLSNQVFIGSLAELGCRVMCLHMTSANERKRGVSLLWLSSAMRVRLILKMMHKPIYSRQTR